MIFSSEKLRVLKGKLQFLKWKLRSRNSRSKGAGFYDIDKIFWIEPEKIKKSLDNYTCDHLTNGSNAISNPMLERGNIQGGDWDKSAIEFERQDVWIAFKQHFDEGFNWQDTEFYKCVIAMMEKGNRMWFCTTSEEFDERLSRIDTLYDEIRKNGYHTQDKIDVGGYKPVGDEDEIQVHIGRDGDYIFGDGRHRFCIAKLLNLEKIPVKVSRRHEKWAALRREILSYANNQPGGKLYSRLTHRDLEDIPAHHEGSDRYTMIVENLPVKSGSVMDIGAHWGYFCHKLEKLGFECTAFEYLAINQYFLKKLRDVENHKFEIVNDSILNYDSEKHFDVVLALNIFHHFIKSKHEFELLEAFLRRLNADCMFFETHSDDEVQMQKSGTYKNFKSEEFSIWVQENAGFKHRQHLGATSEGRQLYLLSR